MRLPRFLKKILKPFSRPIKAGLAKPVSFYYSRIRPDVLDHELTVFVYHDVTDEPSEFSRTYELNVPVALFDRQLTFIKNAFNVISPVDLLESRIPQRATLITFDDGFHSFFENAIPILEKHRIPCIIFLNMGAIKGEMFWSGLITYLCEKRPDFVSYLKRHLTPNLMKFPLYLSCSAELVNSYLTETGEDLSRRVSTFVGEFEREEGLKQAATKDLICYGNHLFNHYVPSLMSDEELLKSFGRNLEELGKYPNYINMFSFPFGQPGRCFSQRQVDLLLDNGVKKVFSSSGTINYEPTASYLDRIALTSWHNSSDRMFFQIFRHRLKGFYDRFFQFPFKL